MFALLYMGGIWGAEEHDIFFLYIRHLLKFPHEIRVSVSKLNLLGFINEEGRSN